MIPVAYESAVPATRLRPEPKGPHKREAQWVREIFDSSGLTQDEFAAKMRISRTALTNWMDGKTSLRTASTRKLTRAAPAHLKDPAWVRADNSGVSDPDRTVQPTHTEAGGYVVQSLEAKTVGDELDAITDPALRRAARTAALNAIAEIVSNPSELVAGNRGDRAQRNK